MSTANLMCLKLTASYLPIEIISVKKAMTLLHRKDGETAEILEIYDDKYFNTFKGAIEAPCVVRLKHFIAPAKDLVFYKPFTRKNVFIRDGGKCQYCGKTVTLRSMTYDHVIPKSQKGLTCWQNIVCACLKCNTKKNNRSPEEAGMKVLQKPYAPMIADSYAKGMMNRIKHIPSILSNKKWAQYIYFNVELEQDKI